MSERHSENHTCFTCKIYGVPPDLPVSSRRRVVILFLRRDTNSGRAQDGLRLGLTQTHMTHKPVLRVEVGAPGSFLVEVTQRNLRTSYIGAAWHFPARVMGGLPLPSDRFPVRRQATCCFCFFFFFFLCCCCCCTCCCSAVAAPAAGVFFPFLHLAVMAAGAAAGGLL